MNDALRSKHSGLINGLGKLFDLLVTLRYLAATDVSHPPHSPPVDVAGMNALGFDPEVVALADLLPQLRSSVVWGYQEEGTALMPRSKAVNYLVRDHNGYDELWERVRLGKYPETSNDVHPLLPPTMLRLTDAGSYGVHLLYDTADQSITAWSTFHNKDWDAYPRRPCSIVLDEIFAKLIHLEWVPLYDPSDGHDPPVRELIETPAIMANEWPWGLGHWLGGVAVPLDDAAFLAFCRQHFNDAGMETLRMQVNYWRALQKLYHDAGWDSTNLGRFDEVKFERERADWLRRCEDIKDEWGKRMEEQLDEEDFRERWEAFWSESAGDRYV